MSKIKAHDKQCTVNIIEMYIKISLVFLFAVVRSEEISSDAKIDTKLLDSSLSTVFPYLSPYNDQQLTKDDKKKSLLLSMPHMQHEHENKTIHKTKRCSASFQRNRSSSMKKNFARINKNSDENINIGVSKNNLYNTYSNLTRNMRENSSSSEENTSDAALREKRKIFLQVLKEDTDEKEGLNLQSRENAKTCNMGKCICYCKDKNYSSTSSKESSSQILDSSKEKINHQIPEHQRLNIVQHKPSRLQYENPYQPRIPNLINSFPRFYQERVSDVPAILIRYGIIPYYMVGNMQKFINVGIPLESEPNFLVGSNIHPQHRSFNHQNTYPNLPVIEKSRETKKLDISTSSPMSYIDTTITETGCFFESYDSTGIIRETQEPAELTTEIASDHAAKIIDSRTKNNFYPTYSTNVNEENNTADISGSDETLHESENSTETILTDYVNTSNAPSIINSPIMHDGKLISMEECMKLFGHDVCVLSATSLQTFADQTEENNSNKYTTIPEYVIQTSTKNSMTTDYANKHFASMLPTSEKLNVDPNENSESTSTELNIVDKIPLSEFSQYIGSVQTYKSHNSDKKEVSITKEIPVSKEELIQTTDETKVKTNKLGKGKNHATNYLKDTKYNYETGTMNLVKSDSHFDEKSLQSVIMQTYEESNKLSNKNDSFNTIMDSSSRLLFCNNILLLNSIRKVINDFALDTRVSRIKDLDENILQLYGGNWLPKILQVPHLKNILLMPQVEDMIVEKVKDILSDVTAIPRKDFANDWSHSIIRSILQSMLEDFPDIHQKLPPMTVEEHQFKNGQWITNLVTLTPSVDNHLSKINPRKLQENIRDFLSSPAIASQTDQHIVRNIIVQSIKNSLNSDEENKETDDSTIYNALNDVLQILKESKDVNILGKSNKFVNNNENIEMTFLQEVPTDRETENINESTLNEFEKFNIEKEARVNNNRMQMTQKAKVLENNVIIAAVSEFPNLSETYDKDKMIYIEKKIPNKIIDIIEGNVKHQISDGTMINVNHDKSEESQLTESLERTIYQKAIIQNNLLTLKTTIKPNLREELNSKGNDKNIFSETTTISSIAIENLYKKSEEQKLSKINPTGNDINESPINNFLSNNWTLENIENHRDDEITTPVLMQETSPDYIQISDDIISPDTAQTENIDDEMEDSLNGKITIISPDIISSVHMKYENPESKTAVTSSAEIDPAIILARLEYNLPSVKYYSPETLKYVQNHHENRNEITTSTNIMQEVSPNYQVQISDSIIGQNMAAAKNAIDEMRDTLNGKILITSADNLILSEDNILKYGNHESQTSLVTDKNISKLQRQNFATEDDVVKIHEVTTEIQRTYAKTTYFKSKSSADDSSRNDLSLSTSETIDDASNGNNENKNSMTDNNNNYDLIGNNMNNIKQISREENEAIIAASKSSLDDIYSLQLFPLSTTSNDISELQNSQLYYISDNMKLPLEIIQLKDGSYALSISKNICKVILRKKCSCCVPLQGRIIRSSQKNHQKIDADEKDYWSSNQSSGIIVNSIIKSTLKTQKQNGQEERTNTHHLWKRNLNKNLTISMPVIDFAKKYNISLNFNEEDVLFDGMESQRRYIEENQSRKLEELNKSEIKNNIQDMNIKIAEDDYLDVNEKMMKYEKETDNSILQNVNILNKKEKREYKESELIDDKQNVARIKIFKENNARPYRYEQNTSITKRGTKVIKSMLYWLKSLFERNE